MEPLLEFLAANANLFFLVAIGAMIAGYAVRGKGSLRAIRLVAIISFWSCLPLCILYGLVAFSRPDPMNFIFAGLWGYNVWSSWTTWRRTLPIKPPSPPVRRN